MTKQEAERFLKDNVASNKRTIQRLRDVAGQRAKVRRLLTAITKLPSAGDLQYYASLDHVHGYNSQSGATKADLSLYLKDEAKNSSLIREIISAGITHKITKEKAGDSLVGRFTYLDTVRVTIRGYVPQSCRIEEKQSERILADAFVGADGVIRQKYVEKVVVCTEGHSGPTEA